MIIGGAVYDPATPDVLGRATDKVHRYDLTTDKWTELASMKDKRAYFGLVLHDGYMYAVCGENNDRA